MPPPASLPQWASTTPASVPVELPSTRRDTLREADSSNSFQTTEADAASIGVVCNLVAMLDDELSEIEALPAEASACAASVPARRGAEVARSQALQGEGEGVVAGAGAGVGAGEGAGARSAVPDSEVHLLLAHVLVLFRPTRLLVLVLILLLANYLHSSRALRLRSVLDADTYL